MRLRAAMSRHLFPPSHTNSHSIGVAPTSPLVRSAPRRTSLLSASTNEYHIPASALAKTSCLPPRPPAAGRAASRAGASAPALRLPARCTGLSMTLVGGSGSLLGSSSGSLPFEYVSAPAFVFRHRSHRQLGEARKESSARHRESVVHTQELVKVL